MIRLHLLGIPHTITRDEFSHCAFTGKVQRFSPMMRSRGFEVYHYGVEGSLSGANKDINLLTEAEWNDLRLESFRVSNPNLDDAGAHLKLGNSKTYVGELANSSYPIYEEFNKKLRVALASNYRGVSTDIVCLPFGTAHEAAITGCNYVCIESGIGYPNAYKNYRIYESHAKLNYDLGKGGETPHNYWFVCPNYYNISDWQLCLTPKVNTIGYLGRLAPDKGVNILVECAKSFPHVKFIICGQGDPSPYLTEPNIVYKEPIHGTDRSDYLGSLVALLTPSMYLEPFCGVSAESQLCGTPVIGSDSGALVENIENFKTGMRCHTLSDYKYGIQLALSSRFDRAYIREKAVELFDMYLIAKKYEYAFKSVLEIYNGSNGWYSSISHIENLV